MTDTLFGEVCYATFTKDNKSIRRKVTVLRYSYNLKKELLGVLLRVCKSNKEIYKYKDSVKLFPIK